MNIERIILRKKIEEQLDTRASRRFLGIYTHVIECRITLLSRALEERLLGKTTVVNDQPAVACHGLLRLRHDQRALWRSTSFSVLIDRVIRCIDSYGEIHDVPTLSDRRFLGPPFVRWRSGERA